MTNMRHYIPPSSKWIEYIWTDRDITTVVRVTPNFNPQPGDDPEGSISFYAILPSGTKVATALTSSEIQQFFLNARATLEDHR